MTAKPSTIYILLRGQYFDDMPRIWGTATTKSAAGKLCRETGHRWSAEQQLFLNDQGDEFGERWWIRVVKTTIGRLRYTDRVSYGHPREKTS